jgi:hypothetical protein
MLHTNAAPGTMNCTVQIVQMGFVLLTYVEQPATHLLCALTRHGRCTTCAPPEQRRVRTLAERAADILVDRPASSGDDDSDFEPVLPSTPPDLQPPDRLGDMWRWFLGLRAAQKLYVVSIAGAVLWLLPNILSLGFVGVERVLVGALIALEEAIVFVLHRFASLGLIAGVAVLALVGVYLFVLDRKST